MNNQSAIEIIYACAAACDHCASACLGEEDVTMMENCIRNDLDCAIICRTTATLLARGSEHGKHILKECIEVCEKCAAECEKHDHEHCRQCAQACRKCVEACRGLEGIAA
jgi:hypothetical protein